MYVFGVYVFVRVVVVCLFACLLFWRVHIGYFACLFVCFFWRVHMLLLFGCMRLACMCLCVVVVACLFVCLLDFLACTHVVLFCVCMCLACMCLCALLLLLVYLFCLFVCLFWRVCMLLFFFMYAFGVYVFCVHYPDRMVLYPSSTSHGPPPPLILSHGPPLSPQSHGPPH